MEDPLPDDIELPELGDNEVVVAYVSNIENTYGETYFDNWEAAFEYQERKRGPSELNDGLDWQKNSEIAVGADLGHDKAIIKVIEIHSNDPISDT